MIAARMLVGVTFAVACAASAEVIAQAPPGGASAGLVDFGNGMHFFPGNVTEQVFRSTHPEFNCNHFNGDTVCSKTMLTQDDCLGMVCSAVTYIFSAGTTSNVTLNPSPESWQAVFDATKRRFGEPKFISVDSLGMRMDVSRWEAATPDISLMHLTGTDVDGRPIRAPYALMICVTKCGDKVQ